MAGTVADLLKPQAPPAPAEAGVSMGDNPFAAADQANNPFAQIDAKAGAPMAPARSTADMLGMGVRGILTGAGGLADIVAGPANTIVNDVLGSHLSTSPGRDLANTASDAMSLPAPVTNLEKLDNAIIEGGTQGLATAGLAAPVASAGGVAGYVARNVAAHPVIDTAASALAGGASEAAAQHGAGPIGQLAAGLAGGVAGVAGARRVADVLEGITARYGAKAARVVTEVPREAVVDQKGNLTDEGKEVAAQSDLHPEQLKAVYDDAEAAAAKAKAEPAVAEPAPAPEGAAVEPATPPAATDVAAPPEAPPPSAPEALPTSAAERVAQAGSEGIDLTRGQATQDFATQEKEQTLLAQPTAEGSAARSFFSRQQEQITAAVDRFKQAIGNPDANATERGQLVKEALTELRDKGKAGVTALYQQARTLAEGLGDQNSNLTRLDTQPLIEAMRGLWSDEAVPDQVRRSLKQQAAKYGLIGESPQTVEGETSVQLRDNTGEPAGKISFVGQQEPLTILNAEDLRQKINQLYDADTSKQTQALKPIIDNAVQQAVERAASEGTGDVGKAFQAARAAHVQQQQTFKAKDVVQKLIDWKKGTSTPVVLPENAIRTIFAGGKDATTDLKKIKAVMLSNPTPKSKAAWAAIQAHAVADIFDKAMVINANPGGGVLGTISGAKLNTAIAKFGADKLRILFSDSDFNQLMKLRRVIGDATIPIQRTTNPSGSGYAVIRFLASQGLRLTAAAVHFVPGVREVGYMASGLVKTGREAAEARRTLAGVEGFDAKAAARADEPQTSPAEYAQRFIQVAGSDEVMAPLIASAASEQRR